MFYVLITKQLLLKYYIYKVKIIELKLAKKENDNKFYISLNYIYKLVITLFKLIFINE